MSKTVIKVENISKLYQLGDVGSGSVNNDLKKWWAKIRGKEDPFEMIAEKNDRTAKGNSDYVWALKDVNFEVQQGEVLGIIGKNGAGKSTLLKILSRTTLPTTGNIKMKGRIASLLEVGTGFHPDLSGRDNIFLNGAILGMTKAEIKNKFDEIVDFSGVERYIDTPVKRYSSGMYVRLAFAVAAHLDPEILIVDEVLAVGDYEFQKKCLGKMKDVSGLGRTVLFVSHNTTALKSLCSKALFLEHGMVKEMGQTEEIVNKYLSKVRDLSLNKTWTKENAPGNDHVTIYSAKITTDSGTERIDINTSFEVDIEFELTHPPVSFFTGILFNTLQDEMVFVSPANPIDATSGRYTCKCKVPGKLLNNRGYTLNIYFVKNRQEEMYLAESLLTFEVFDLPRGEGVFLGDYVGNIRPQLDWSIKRIN
jgi:lipopolysaccharide transport system ATP-binding protein